MEDRRVVITSGIGFWAWMVVIAIYWGSCTVSTALEHLDSTIQRTAAGARP